MVIDWQLLSLVWPKLAGVVLFMDGLYSYLLYVGKPSYRGAAPQTWLRDHWVRAVRSGIGIALVFFT